MLTHFGAFDDPRRHIAELRERLDHWSQCARELDEATYARALEGESAAATDPQTAASYDQAAPADACWQGLDRYWSKRALS
jgi:hypothetical protein